MARFCRLRKFASSSVSAIVAECGLLSLLMVVLSYPLVPNPLGFSTPHFPSQPRRHGQVKVYDNSRQALFVENNQKAHWWRPLKQERCSHQLASGTLFAF